MFYFFSFTSPYDVYTTICILFSIILIAVFKIPSRAREANNFLLRHFFMENDFNFFSKKKAAMDVLHGT